VKEKKSKTREETERKKDNSADGEGACGNIKEERSGERG
jgi:hypothetical protein